MKEISMKIIKKLFSKNSSSYEKWYEKNLKEAKENYVTISKLEFLDAFSSAMAIVGPIPEEMTHLLAVIGAIVAGKIFDKQKSDEEK